MAKPKKFRPLRALRNMLMRFGWRLAVLYLRKITPTLRVREVDHQHRVNAMKVNQGRHVIAVWHECVLLATYAQFGRPYVALTSTSAAGRTASFIFQKLGFKSVSGSQRNGGKESRQVLLNLLDNHQWPAITVDGSSGPRRFCKPGVVYLAAKGRVPILPVSARANFAIVLPTWDRMRMPLPFSRIEVLYGEPIHVPDGEDVDFSRYQALVGERLNKLLGGDSRVGNLALGEDS